MSNKKKTKRLPTEVKSKCSSMTCDTESDKFLTCVTCNLLLHPECGSFDTDLFQLLSEKKIPPGFSWSWKCTKCVIIDDDINKRNTDINELICKKFDEIKSHIDKNFSSDKQNKTQCLPKKVTITSTEVQTINSTDEILKDSQESKTKMKDPTNPTMNVAENKMQICGYYKQGKCRHGGNGKKLFDGQECLFSHPRKCIKYCRYGGNSPQGCDGNCEYFHPILCKNSVQFKQCLLPNCTFAHLQGTKRTQSLVQPLPYNVEPTYRQNGNFRENFRGHPGSYGRMSNSNISLNNMPEANSNWNMAAKYQRGGQRRLLTREGYYNNNDFPPLQHREDPNVLQLSSAIKDMQNSIMQNSEKMQNSITYLIKNIAPERFQAPVSNHPQARVSFPNITSTDPHTNMHPTHSEAKNFQRQALFHQEN